MKHTNPRYRIGQGVYYPVIECFGTIRAILNQDDLADVRQQGYRYEVEFRSRSELWSVLEGELLSNRTSRHKKKARTAQELPETVSTPVGTYTEYWNIGGVIQPVIVRRFE